MHDAPDAAAYMDSIEEFMARCNVPGLSIVVIRDFQIHWARGYGIADREAGQKVDSETLFQAGSISKPVAAMALVKAVQDGRFSLDDDINDILRSWKLRGGPFTHDRQVTPRMLASHTSGLGDGFGFPGYPPHTPTPTTVQILEGQPPSNTGPVLMERPPFTAMKYSGGGAMVLQLALEDALGLPFAQILRNDVLDPIGMTASAYEQPLSPARDRHAARAHDGGEPGDVKWRVHPELFAAGLWTTSEDLARYAIEVQLSVHGESNRVLSQAMAREMLRPVGVGDYAVGFKIERRGRGSYFSHWGINHGFVSLLEAHVLRGYGFVAMANAGVADAEPVIDEVRSRVETAYGWDSLDER